MKRLLLTIVFAGFCASVALAGSVFFYLFGKDRKVEMKMLIILLSLFLVANSISFADPVEIDFFDNALHILSDATYQDNGIRVDMGVDNYPGTRIEMVDNGIARFIHMYSNSDINMDGGLINLNLAGVDSSTINMSNGTIGGDFEVYDNAFATVSGGSFGHMRVSNNSEVIMTGGAVGLNVTVLDDAVATISGGTITGSIAVGSYNGTIYLDGTDFAINGISLTKGDKLSDFGTLVENSIYDYYEGTITGILSDGSIMNNDFKIFNQEYLAGYGDIIIVPEPTSLLLFGAGLVLLRRRNDKTRVH